MLKDFLEYMAELEDANGDSKVARKIQDLAQQVDTLELEELAQEFWAVYDDTLLEAKESETVVPSQVKGRRFRNLEPNYRIMYWKEASGSLDFSEGWFYIHDQETGDPIECDSLREVEKAFIAAMNQGHKPQNLKVVKEYPIQIQVGLRYE